MYRRQGAGQLSGRSPDARSIGLGFESQQETFLLLGQLSVLALISADVLPWQHVKDPGQSAWRAVQ